MNPINGCVYYTGPTYHLGFQKTYRLTSEIFGRLLALDQ